MNLSRRKFLQTAFSLGFAIATKKGWANKLAMLATERRDLFPQGVASGDPTANSVILWTRRPPVNDRVAAKLTVEISTDPEFKKYWQAVLRISALIQIGHVVFWQQISNPTVSIGTGSLMSMVSPAVSVVR
ncbi:MAG TPA: PhoD-like phosphatase N-terminal domain-containing protein [Flavitalea sp.]|nr:PhoD-like phosphatase N-terminal domain-containing protein [Flavitalea sp.]